MIGVSPRRPSVRFSGGVGLVIVLAACVAFRSLLPAQTPTDDPGLPAAPDSTPSVSTNPNSVLPPYAPSNNAASPLLPASPPLPPHPSIPDPTLLPDSTPPPAPTPFPLPVPAQTGAALSPVTSGAPLTNGAPGTTPDTLLPGGATTTNNTGAVRRFQYAFRLNTGFTYDDNIFLNGNGTAGGRGLSRSDVYFFIEPSVSLGYGDFLTRATNYVELDYTLDALLFTRNTSQDTVQHFVNLQGAYHFAQVTFTLSQGVQILDSTDLGAGGSGGLLGSANTPATSAGQVNLDASQRTRLNIFTTRVDANYAFSDKTSVDLDGYFSAYDYASLTSSDTISGDAYFNYSPTGKITLGLGVTGGYVIQDAPAPDEYFQQLNLRLSYAATTKLSAAGSVGLEVREISGGGGTEVNPIFNLTVTYAPRDSTSLSFTASRNIDTSAVLTGENFDTTGFTFTVSQRFFQRATASLSLGYTNSDYVTTGRGVGLDRTDDYYFVQPGIDYTIRDNLSVGLFYSHRQNASSLSGNSFNDNQIGAHVSLSF